MAGLQEVATVEVEAEAAVSQMARLVVRAVVVVMAPEVVLLAAELWVMVALVTLEAQMEVEVSEAAGLQEVATAAALQGVVLTVADAAVVVA